MRYLAILLIGLLSACASQIMQGYVGKPLTEPIFDYGMPASAFDMGNGRRAFIWEISSSYYVPQTTTLNASIVGNQLFANSITSGGYTATNQCAYVLYAERSNDRIAGPAGWMVVGYRAPRPMCE